MGTVLSVYMKHNGLQLNKSRFINWTAIHKYKINTKKIILNSMQNKALERTVPIEGFDVGAGESIQAAGILKPAVT